jgi:hypothetical protein
MIAVIAGLLDIGCDPSHTGAVSADRLYGFEPFILQNIRAKSLKSL